MLWRDFAVVSVALGDAMNSRIKWAGGESSLIPVILKSSVVVSSALVVVMVVVRVCRLKWLRSLRRLGGLTKKQT
jgi:hypothetical protein